MMRCSIPLAWLATMAIGCGSEQTPAPPTPATPPQVSLSLVTTLSHGNDADALAFSPDGSLLATGHDVRGGPGTVKLWSTSDWTEVASFPGFSQSVYSLAFVPGASLLVGGGFEPAGGDVKLWEVPGGRVVWHYDRYMPRSVAVSPDGQTLAISSSDDNRIEIVALPDGGVAHTFTAHARALLDVAFSDDGRYLVSGGADHVVKVWDVPGFTEVAAFTGHTAPVWSVAFSPGGEYVASGTIDGTARVWRLSDGSAFRTWHQEDWVWSVAFSPDGELLASGGYAGVRLYRVADQTEAVAEAGPLERATELAFSPDGRHLVAALADNVDSTPGTIRIWRVSR